MKPNFRSILEVIRDVTKEQRDIGSEMRAMEKIRDAAESTDEKEKLSVELEERSAVFRHLGMHIQSVELYMEGKVHPYQTDRVKEWTKSLSAAKKALKAASDEKLKALYEKKVTYLELVELSASIEYVPSFALLVALHETGKEIEELEGKLTKKA